MRALGGVGARLTVALLVVVAGVLAIIYLIVVPSYRHSLENSEIRTLARAMRTVVVRNYPANQLEKRQAYAEVMAPRVNARVVVYDLQNSNPVLLQPVADSSDELNSSAVENDPIASNAIVQRTVAQGTVEREDGTYAEVAYPLGNSVILLSASLHDQLRTVSVVRRRVFVAGGVALAFAILLGYAGAAGLGRRIRRLEAAAERIAAGDFSEPVVDPGTDELGQLARAFERMRLRLAGLDRARGEFIANASHELRTPLFSLGGFLELLDDPELEDDTRDAFLAQMREQVDRLAKLATDLLDLSRLDAGRLGVADEAIDLAELADDLARELLPRATALGHSLAAVKGGPAPARGDEARVLQIGRILVENALVHTASQTSVRIETVRDGGRALLAVSDDGAGIPAEARGQVFERFQRLEGARASGSGLGLAIARELAALMDGRLELDETAEGGARFTLTLRSDLSAPAVFP